MNGKKSAPAVADAPVNIILVKNGSKGDRLLFRYPFNQYRVEDVIANVHDTKPYALNSSMPEDNTRSPPFSNISNGQLVGFPDEVLSNLFAVKMQLCSKKFELKVNDVRFVGHPTLLEATYASPKRLSGSLRQSSTTINQIHIVFALPANADSSIVHCYHDLSYRLGIGLQHEERRCQYLSKEAKIMLTAHDEVQAANEKKTPFELILKRCQLARNLKFIYEELCSSGIVQMRINSWIHISFCLPQKIHSSVYQEHKIDAAALQKCLNALRPYHALLLLVNESDLLNDLPSGASPSLVRLIQASSPLKSLQELAIDADLSLTQVFQLVGHLIYWAKVTVIYPLCETNVYVLASQAPTHVSSSLTEEFFIKFPGISLLIVMAEFSLPVSLSQHGNLTHLADQQTQLLQIIIWMLQHNLLMQLHTYVYYVPFCDNEDEVIESSPRMLSGEINSTGFFTGDSDLGSDSTEFSPHSSALNVRQIGHLLKGFAEPASSEIQIPAIAHAEDLDLFNRLSVYFNGTYHLEEIMYYENVRRTELLVLLDKFRHVLITCQHEDDAVAIFYNHRNT